MSRHDITRARRTTNRYTSAQYDRAFAEHFRSDTAYVVTRALTLLVVFWFMWRAVRAHDVSAGFLLLPLAVELLSAFWLGLFLSWFLVDCPKFRHNARSPAPALFCTGLFAIVISFVLAVEDQTLLWNRVIPGWVSGWHTVVDTGLVWALLAELLMLVFSSIREVLNWRRRGGDFLWTSILDSGLRFAALLLTLVAGVFLFIFLGGLLEHMLGELSAAWLVFAFLLVIETGALMIGVKVHHKVLRERAEVVGSESGARVN